MGVEICVRVEGEGVCMKKGSGEGRYVWEWRKGREVLCNFLCMTVCFVGLCVCARACVWKALQVILKWSSQCVSREG